MSDQAREGFLNDMIQQHIAHLFCKDFDGRNMIAWS